MKYFALTCAITATMASALDLGALNIPSGTNIEITINVNNNDENLPDEVENVTIKTDDNDEIIFYDEDDEIEENNDYETDFVSYTEQEDHTEDIYDDPIYIQDYDEAFNDSDDQSDDVNLESGNSQPATETCWLKAYGRGVGKVISTCPSDKEKNGFLCYPKCRSGFKGVGPVCWQYCPKNFRDDGAFCAKPAPYGRGTGSFTKHKGYERWGLLYYPKCKTNFHNVACCICSPDCPSGMTDIGVSCAKKSYGRTAGTPLTCKSNEELSGALCYPPCRDGFKGIGPVCWG